jgi:hypothetical protein
MVMQSGITVTLPITGMYAAISANGPLVTVARYRDRQGRILAQPDKSVEYAQRQQFAVYNLDTGETKDLPIFCPGICWALFLSADQSAAALSYHCGLEENHYIIAAVDKLQDQLEDMPCPEGFERVLLALPDNQGFLISDEDGLALRTLDGTRATWPERGHAQHLSADGTKAISFSGTEITLTHWETLAQEQISIPKWFENPSSRAVLMSPDEQYFLIDYGRSNNTCIYLVSRAKAMQRPRCILHYNEMGNNIDLLAWLP